MNGKQAIIEAVRDRFGITKKYSGEIVSCVLESMGRVITNDLGVDEIASFTGLGNFKKVLRAEHNGRNPSTGEAIVIPAKEVVRFKASPSLSE